MKMCQWTVFRLEINPSQYKLLETPNVYQLGFEPTALKQALDQFNMYPNMPPPTYAQSVWSASNVRSDDEHLGGDFEFLPKYAI